MKIQEGDILHIPEKNLFYYTIIIFLIRYPIKYIKFDIKDTNHCANQDFIRLIVFPADKEKLQQQERKWWEEHR